MNRISRILVGVALFAVLGVAAAAVFEPGMTGQMLHTAFQPEVLGSLMLANAPVGIAEIKALVEKQGQAWEDFKKVNDQLLAAKADGKSVSDLEAQLAKVNAEMNKLADVQKDLSALNERMAGLQLAGSPAAVEKELADLEVFNRMRGASLDVDGLRNYKKALNVYMRRGDATPADVKAALSAGSDPDGGYTVTPDMSGRIIQRVFETSPMRQVATVDSIGSDVLEGFNDLNEASSGGWVSEMSTARDTETNTPQIGKWQIPVHEQYAMPKTTQKLLDDSSWDMEGWLARKVADKFTRTENTAYYTGNGVGKPRGICDYTTAATADASRAWGQLEHVITTVNGGFGATDPGDELIDLVFKLKVAYRANAVWMMARSTVAAVRKLKDRDGQYLWTPNFQERQGGLLLGYPIVEAEDMPVIANSSLSIAFGDFREGYQIVDRLGIRVLRDPYTSKGFVKFFTTRRTGGGVLNFDAIKFLKFSNA